ncbi:MAG: type sorting protein [Ignavibacteria bacterium]|nr:type sorting protein [Ignavibacteria bacterium]
MRIFYTIFLAISFLSISVLAEQNTPYNLKEGTPDSGVKLATLEPPNGRVYHGVGQAGQGVNEYCTALGDSTIQPAVVKYYYDIPGTRGNKFIELRQTLANEKKIGRIPELSIAMTDGKVWTDSIIATSSLYDKIIDTLALICKDYGLKMFIRPGFEFNGSWNPYHPYLYPKAFQKIVNRFRTIANKDSLAFEWCYYAGGNAPNDFDSIDSRGYRWYPGDTAVDWFSLDVFNVTDFHPDSAAMLRGKLTTKGKSERFLSMARAKGKPVYLSETTAQGINISSNQSDSQNDWNKWFVPFFKFISDHPEIKGFNYINWDWSKYPTWAAWGDARIENSPYIISKYKEEMKNPKYIHLPFKTTVKDTFNLTPITELGTNLYKTFPGGLYPEGSNTRPTNHNDAGKKKSIEIIPLDTTGESNEQQGKIVLLSVGMSNCTQEFSTFKPIADTLKAKNPKLVIVDGAQGGQTASVIQNPNANFWSEINRRLGLAKVSAQQVQIVWLKEADAGPKNDFPVHAQTLTKELKIICQILKAKYPNIKICYFSSRTYGGYATTTLNPEPMAYETGFSVKWLIESQINGDTTLSYEGNNVRSPWLSWGPYLWGNGTKPRLDDGLVWLETDFVTSDYTHPSPSGRLKVAQLLLKFFTNDETATPWFLKSGSTLVEENEISDIIEVNPNPAYDYIYLNNMNEQLEKTITIYSIEGFEVLTTKNISQIYIGSLAAGVYIIKVAGKSFKFVKM